MLKLVEVVVATGRPAATLTVFNDEVPQAPAGREFVVVADFPPDPFTIVWNGSAFAAAARVT